MLFTQRPRGSIYWVVSFFQTDPDFQQRLATADTAWSEPAFFERIVVMKEQQPASVPESMDRLVSWLETKASEFQPVLTLRGGVYQARGEIDEAADAYRRAGIYYPQLAEEFLATARGFAARGNERLAWREALTSKFMRPGSPEVHDWLAQHLRARGHPAQAEAEERLARSLR
jgi:hypothetical protein